MTEEFNDLLAPSLGDGRPTWFGPDSPLPTDERELLRTVSDGYASAVAIADFAEKVRLAGLLAEIGDRRFDEAALYLRAEGLRIQADFDPSSADQLRAEALDCYDAGLDLDPSSVRCERGRGRILEVTGHLDEAFKVLSKAFLISSVADSDRAFDGGPAHEVIRSTRHAVACWAELVLRQSTGAHATEMQKRIWTGRIYDSLAHHERYLSRFEVEPRWKLIEQFMGYSMLAKGATAAGENELARRLARDSLRSRLQMEKHLVPMSPVFWGNLQWWLKTARDVWADSAAETRAIEIVSVSDADGLDTLEHIFSMCDLLGVGLDHQLRYSA